ncbi:MAG: hypothetical protein JWL96_3821 [Sphingomonas bacterium]|nr:hypothetical protein [Sphingomonas bacterium]
MKMRFSLRAVAPAALMAVGLSTSSAAQRTTPVVLDPAHMPRVATVDERYQSYNIEMIQVMGGRWWSPYGATAASAAGGFASSPMQYRPPTDLADPRLRKLAAALSPAFVRVSDNWANTVYFQDDDKPALGAPPPGFRAVITRRQWQGVIDFSQALDARVVTSFSIGDGVRDANGVWTPVEAKKLLAFFRRSGSSIAAAEFFNEPNLGVTSGTPKGYDATAYARDYKVFSAYIRAADPRMKLLGPGPVGEDTPLPGLPKGIPTEDILRATGPGLDGVSWHFYGAVSHRCAAFGPRFQTTPEQALTPAWLATTDKVAAYYAGLRDRYEPGKPLWLSETADAACGGNPWAASFVDSFRYLNQLGVLAKRGVKVVMHNTLAGSDYGLIDDVTLAPRPNYWAALLWRRLMGTIVLDAGASPSPDLHLYAQCLRGRPGGVALLAINADRGQTHDVALPVAGLRYTLSAKDLLGREVDLNGRPLRVTANGALPPIEGVRMRAGSMALPPASITFLALPGAGNARCR